MTEKRSYYAIIPANVRYNENITANSKLLYGEITALCNEKGYCWAGDNYFQELYGVSKSTIQRWLKDLEENSLIYREVRYAEDSKKIEQRYIKLTEGHIPKNEHTPIPKNEYRYTQKRDKPIPKNERDNNTSNTTLNNNTNTTNINNKQTTFSKVEQEFGRPLSPIEMETINYWEEDYTEDMIDCAIREAVMNGKYNLKYIEAILRNWEKNNLKTKQAIAESVASFRSNKKSNSVVTSNEELPEVPMVNWVESSE